jgi:hypothetical protein
MTMSEHVVVFGKAKIIKGRSLKGKESNSLVFGTKRLTAQDKGNSHNID